MQRTRSSGLTVIEIDVALDTPDAAAADRLSALNQYELATRRRRLQYIGSTSGFVELLTELAAHSNGVRLFPMVIDQDLPALARYVLPALLRTGVAHRPVPGSSLRGHLGLDRPANRYAKV